MLLLSIPLQAASKAKLVPAAPLQLGIIFMLLLCIPLQSASGAKLVPAAPLQLGILLAAGTYQFCHSHTDSEFLFCLDLCNPLIAVSAYTHTPCTDPCMY
jgi:hypothetical protein